MTTNCSRCSASLPSRVPPEVLRQGWEATAKYLRIDIERPKRMRRFGHGRRMAARYW